MKKLLFILVSSLLVIGCRRKQPTPPDLYGNDPIFQMEGTIAGESVSMTAGEEGYYMWTRADVLNGVREFSGELSQENNGLSIRLYDSQTGFLNSFAAIPEGAYEYAGQIQQVGGVLYIDTASLTNVTNIDWTVNGDAVADWSVISTLPPGIYDVCAYVTFGSGCTESICDEVFLGFEDGCPVDFNASVQGDSVFLEALTLPNVYGMQWTIDGAVVSDTNTFIFQSQEDVLQVCLEVLYSDGCTGNICKNIQLAPTNCYFEAFQFLPLASTDFFEKITVDWMQDGQVFTSAAAEQGPASFFNISDVVHYLNNESGQHTIRFNANFSCYATDTTSGQTIFLENFSGSFGFALTN